MIAESYVSFDTAKLLKEVGFNVPCEKWYGESGFFMSGNYKECKCPTQALAARWLREVHRISVDAAFMAPSTNIDVWQYFIGKMDDMIWPGDFETSERTYATYEEAMETGLQEAIKLIKK